MNTEFTTLIQTLVTERGTATLTDARKCKGLLADYTHGEYVKETRLVQMAVEAGVPAMLQNGGGSQGVYNACISKLHDEYFLDKDVAADVVEMIAGVIGVKTLENTTTPNKPKPEIKQTQIAAPTIQQSVGKEELGMGVKILIVIIVVIVSVIGFGAPIVVLGSGGFGFTDILGAIAFYIITLAMDIYCVRYIKNH
jgi:hypothetical protein